MAYAPITVALLRRLRRKQGRPLRENAADIGIHREREHVVTRVNDYHYVCEECGQAGSARWAILHQYPTRRLT
ncbi:hypothetical protein A5746_10355 [Mycolicibacterium conceptionense]|uniref:hypothetical protein n=1 Tax=Mycolicibacterium conceptionense TaxID=451644 RepID=UPI0007ED8808|nr:hypothetical protein [Mycolicibacterium conceptionense]OBK04690.1 hypothetical protein A5639_20680 [Mycolicibacterium conceptionense]OMB90331.1 hypothetical protein A5741_12175 [Mycolicibacterium conceptionense]OMC02088.1 hypothetical protein A5746_10355 [Mycolicibacterium conceptionense]